MILRRACFALTLLALGCSGGGEADAGVDAGGDAGLDGGSPDGGHPNDGGNTGDGGDTTDAGDTSDAGLVCDGGVLIDGSEGGYIAPAASTDGVVGVPSTVWRLAQQYSSPSAPPVPLACISAVVTAPGGQVVTSSLSADSTYPQWVTATFVPPATGTYHVTLAISNGDTFENDVTVYDLEPPGFTLARNCGSVVSAAGFVGCDETLFDLDGSVVASLDGGLWLDSNDQLIAWQDGALAFASVDDGGVSFGPAVAAPPVPSSWSTYGAQLAVGGVVSGTLYAVNAGTLSALGSLPAGWVDVLSNGSVLSLELNQPNPFGLLYSANADQLVSAGFNGLSAGPLTCFAPDAGGGASESPCGAMFSPQYYRDVNARRLPRRPLAETTQGVRLPGTGAMHLPSAFQITDDDEIVWQSSASQTAVWFR